MNYRREIDGLRAIALLPVTLFHAGFESFSGGFVGVDVFFVISGYLITSIIAAEREAGTYSLVGFYERRARRILPALLFVMLACLPFAYAWMLPDDLENFGQSLVATTAFSNNILLWLTSGYFALASEFKPLVHTWSLGIEEQYYVVFPLLMALLWPLGMRRLVAVLAVLGIASLVAAEWGSTHRATATFYLLHTRAWELLLGSMIALYLLHKPDGWSPDLAGRRIDEAASVLGFALIAVAVFALDRHTPFPGLYALLPTLGTALVILFANPRTLVGRALACRPLVGIGLISYSGYLWQQPLFAFARIRSLEEPSLALMGGLALLSLALAWLSWSVVERPFRDRRATSRRTIVLAAVLGSALTAGAGLVIHQTSGFAARWNELDPGVAGSGRRLNAAYNEDAFRFKGRTFAPDAGQRVLVLGHSFARDFINAGVETGRFSRSSLVYSDRVPVCVGGPDEIDPAVRDAIAQADYLIWVVRPMRVECWAGDSRVFRALGAKRLLVIGTKNFGWNMNAVMQLDPAVRYGFRAKVLDETIAENDRMRATIPPEEFVDVLAMLADADGRVAVFTEDRKIISQDREHLTKDGARFVGARIFEHPSLAPLQ